MTSQAGDLSLDRITTPPLQRWWRLWSREGQAAHGRAAPEVCCVHATIRDNWGSPKIILPGYDLKEQVTHYTLGNPCC